MFTYLHQSAALYSFLCEKKRRSRGVVPVFGQTLNGLHPQVPGNRDISASPCDHPQHLVLLGLKSLTLLLRASTTLSGVG
ncbi:hypothetical protein EVAR_38283_1 [Eumeta japonica]|uniref:Uncharacterized protein n=1 Tax=Eumeta variegata TaxID=151549 RepID=A0A4C1W7X1_EUMVA|nr:hypothetical protein EVAR_38283_1 [Eumeta japonica]